MTWSLIKALLDYLPQEAKLNLTQAPQGPSKPLGQGLWEGFQAEFCKSSRVSSDQALTERCSQSLAPDHGKGLVKGAELRLLSLC